MIKQKRQLSEQAQVAKICRQYVKSLGLEVNATSDSFSMGNSVDVRVVNATGEQRDMINSELKQYQYGHFDGMNDMYENSNYRNDIPQTKYLHIHYSYSTDFEQAAYEWSKQHAMASDEAAQLPEHYIDADKNFRLFNDFLSSVVYRTLNGSNKRWIKEENKDVDFWHDFKPHPPTPPTKPTKSKGGAPSVEGAEVHEILHTKKEVNIYIVTLPSMERDTFNEMRDHVKSLGGWYSRKWGNSPAGFAFNTREEAESFAGGQSENTNQPTQASAPNEKQAEKLETIAEKAASEAQDKLADRLTNTPKRLAQAMSARIDGQRLERVATVAQKLADLWRAGDMPQHLAKYTSKKSLVDALGAELEPVPNGFHTYHMDTGKPHNMADANLWALLDESSSDNELVKLENAVKFANIEGYFPTPDAVASEMLNLISRELLAKDDAYILEPSAGRGNLCEIAQRQWPKGSILAVEQNHTLYQLLEAKGFNTEPLDFMGVEVRQVFDVVLMNPPFERMQDIEHISRAYEWLVIGGELVAVASAGVLFRNDAKTTAFREWVDMIGGTIEPLPDNSFKESGTSVNTVIIHVKRC